ncbi:TolC family protein [Sulfurimonas sp.]|uniref:TolC family protein n=1 Tax=Sulfurimonas sp. TaxID=2022749 RepID=UPI003562839D
MKVLNLWIALLVLCNIANAEEQLNESLEKYISDSKKQQFEYSYEKNEAESSKLRDSWIAPFMLNYSFTKNKQEDEATSTAAASESEWDQESASVTWTQPIFQSGGIYYGIKYATASGKYANYSVDVQKRKLVKDAISILMQIKQIDLRVKRQNLQIRNTEIALEQVKEQYLSGQLDSSFLDNAIIDRNVVIQALYDIETNKERLISSFEALSDMNYKEARIPSLGVLSKDDFLTYNIVLQMSDSEVEKNRYFKDVTIAKYLPKVDFIADYTWTDETKMFGTFDRPENTSYSYGVKASIPLNINTFVDVSSSRVDYLKAKVVVEDKKRELSAIYDQVMQNIDNLDKKKQLSVENKDIYKKLLDDTTELYKAGYKTEYDVELLKNSFEMAELDSKIYDIDKQLELLTLYEMYKKD